MMNLKNIFLAYIIFALLSGCANQDFPDCCESDGNRDTPFKVTNVFGFKTGVRDIKLDQQDIEGYMFIISSADLLTLLAAANSEIVGNTGTVTGLVFADGRLLKEVVILPTDEFGRSLEKEVILVDDIGERQIDVTIRNLFYNNLGRVPDITLEGTNDGGGFTAFNAEPGETFFWAAEGARGSGHWTAFKDQVSVGSFDVVAVPRSKVTLMGKIISGTEGSADIDLPLEQSSVVILGFINNLEFFNNLGGIYELRTTVTAFPGNESRIGSDCTNEDLLNEIVSCETSEVTLPTNGTFFAMVTSTSTDTPFWKTIQQVTTPFSQVDTLLPFQKLTFNVSGISRAFIKGVSEQPDTENKSFKRVVIDESKGILFGTVRVDGGGGASGVSGLSIDASVTVTDRNGTKAGEILYLDADLNQQENGGVKTGSSGRFIAFNLEPGLKYLSVVADPASQQCFGESELGTGGKPINLFQGSVLLDTTMISMLPNKGCGVAAPALKVELSGIVVDTLNNLVPDLKITFIGFESTGDNAVSAMTDAMGAYPLPGTNTPVFLTTNSSYLARLEDTGAGAANHLVTYREVETGNVKATRNMQVVNMQSVSINGEQLPLPLVIVELSDLKSGLSVEDASVRITDMSGKEPAGIKVYYYNSDGSLSLSRTKSSSLGRFVVSGFGNVPAEGSESFTGTENLYNVIVNSGDDSGSIIVQVYEQNAVTFKSMVVSKVLPRDILISGRTVGLDGTVVPDARALIVGKPKKITIPVLVSPSDAPLPPRPTWALDKEAFRDENSVRDDGLIQFLLDNNVVTDAVGKKDHVVFSPSVIDYNDLKSRLIGTSLSSEQITTVLGIWTQSMELDSFTSDSAGVFSKAVPTNSTLIIKVEADQCYNTYNYDKKISLVDMQSDIVCATLNEVGRYRNDAGLSATPGVGSSMATGMAAGYLFSADLSDGTAANETIDIGVPPVAMVVDHFNSDRFIDIAVASGSGGKGTIMFYLGDGDGNFKLSSLPPISLDIEPDNLIYEDLNQDGSKDLISFNRSSGKIVTIMNRGTELLFGSPLSSCLDGSVDSSGNCMTPLADLDVGDLNRDGFVDIAALDASSATGAIKLFLNNFDASFAAGNTIDTSSMPNRIVGADMNNNGLIDFMVTSPTEGSVRVHLSGGDGTLTNGTGDLPPVAEQLYSTGGTPVDLIAADLNADLLPEIIVVNDDTRTLSILVNSQDNVQVIDFNKISTYKVTGTPTAVAAGDLDGDNRVDLMVAHTGPAGVSVFFGNGDGTVNASPLEKSIGSGPVGVLTADMNNDAKIDMVMLDNAAMKVRILHRVDMPLENVGLSVTDRLGGQSGKLYYFDAAGADIDPGLTRTSASGRFIVFDIDDDYLMVNSLWDEKTAKGANGNKGIRVVRGAMTFFNMRVTTLPPNTVSIEGLTLDPVGASPGGTAVTPVKVRVVGTRLEVVSSDSSTDSGSFQSARYIFDAINASSEYQIVLELVGK